MSCTDLLWRLAVALLTAFFLFADSLAADAADTRTLAARPVQGDIVLDGFLNEPAWDQALPLFRVNELSLPPGRPSRLPPGPHPGLPVRPRRSPAG